MMLSAFQLVRSDSKNRIWIERFPQLSLRSEILVSSFLQGDTHLGAMAMRCGRLVIEVSHFPHYMHEPRTRHELQMETGGGVKPFNLLFLEGGLTQYQAK